MEKSWKLYERMIAQLLMLESTTDHCVTPNARIMGKISGRSRQIDVLIDVRHDTDNSRRIIIDAKKRKRKIDVKDVEAFLGLIEDVNATHGYLISPAGHTKSAERRAQMAVSIRIVPTDRLENFDPSTWPHCRHPRCKHGRVFWDGYPELSMVYRAVGASEKQPLKKTVFVHYVGKCDRCGHFHVWCTTCRDLLSVPEGGEDDHGYQCNCRLPWFWLASVEEDEQQNKSAELHVIYGGEIRTVNRRPLARVKTTSKRSRSKA